MEVGTELDIHQHIESGEDYLELIPGVYVGCSTTISNPEWQRKKQISYLMCCSEESSPDLLLGKQADLLLGKQADLQVTTNLIPLPANGGDIAAEAFVEMMSDSSEFLTEGTEAGKKIALFSDGEGDWDRAVVCVVAWLVRSMSLEEALGTMKTQIPDYYMSSPYHSMLKRLAKKPAPKNDKAHLKKSQATLPKKVEPKKGESFFIECPSCTSASCWKSPTSDRCGKCGTKYNRPGSLLITCLIHLCGFGTPSCIVHSG